VQEPGPQPAAAHAAMSAKLFAFPPQPPYTKGSQRPTLALNQNRGMAASHGPTTFGRPHAPASAAASSEASGEASGTEASGTEASGTEASGAGAASLGAGAASPPPPSDDSTKPSQPGAAAANSESPRPRRRSGRFME